MTSHPHVLVIGAGYVGLATAVFLADKGCRVNVVDKNTATVISLSQGRLHFREPLLQTKLKQVLKRGKLLVSRPTKEHYRQVQFIFIAIDSVDPTSWKMRLASFEKMVTRIADTRSRTKVTVVLKSTNIIGFADQFQRLLTKAKAADRVHLVVNPEFLREGCAYQDTCRPWRVVIGADIKAAAAPLLRLYRSVYRKTMPFVVTDCKSAELIKLGSNVYLAHRLAFIHEIAEYARADGMDIQAIRRGIGLDPRIRQDYFDPGLGFGGSCLPKDCHLLNSEQSSTHFDFLSARTALEINERLLNTLIDRLKSKLGKLKGKKIAILGAAFKSEVDDTRGSQAVKLALKLRRRGARVVFFEPYLKGHGKLTEGNFPMEDSVEAVVKSASAVIIGTAHRQFNLLKPIVVGKLVKRKLVIDYFRILNRIEWRNAGFTLD